MELSKRDKKAAREVIDKALQRDFQRGLLEFDAILAKWKNQEVDNRQSYYDIYSSVKKFDKYIARRYDDLRGSTYYILGLLHDGIIQEEDLSGFSDEVAQAIINHVNSLKE